jgi:tetratricopeptide (TPR) repeat protein
VYRAWFVLFASGVALAAPPKAMRKPAPTGLDAEALDTFVQAVLLDKAGDYDAAITRYDRDKLDNIPEVVYNIADLHRRSEEWDRAIKAYKKYLELAPNAPDRAAVQKLIDQIEKTPQTIVVDGEDFDAVVFIDGKLAGPSPLVTSLPDGHHVVERIGPASYEHESVMAAPKQNRHITGYAEAKGNVVMSSNSGYGGSWRDGDKFFQMNGRFTLPPGRVDTFWFQAGRACSPISFEVPAEGMVYVFVDAPKDPKRGACTPIKVSVQRFQFPGAKK